MNRNSSSNGQSIHSILIIDDDPMCRTLYVEQLKGFGINATVSHSENGFTGIVNLAQRLPDLIILDLHMPMFDGYSFLEIVKTKPAYREVPIVVITTEDRAKLKPIESLPNVHIFRKPLHSAVFGAILKFVIGEKIQVDLSKLSPSDSTSELFRNLDCAIGKNRSLQRQVAEQFCQLAPERIAQLESALAQVSFRSLSEWCHVMSGTAAIVGANTLCLLVKRLGVAANSNDLSESAIQSESIIKELRSVSISLAQAFSLDF